MLNDTYKRKIDYLRISVTDRCNLRCIYCMPGYGIAQKEPQDILTFEEITSLVRLAVEMGIDKIKLTGGEPLVRKGLLRLIEFISRISRLKDLSLTTNGTLLAKHAKALKEAGLQRLNVSMDTLDSQKFHYITEGGRLEDVLEGIDAALEEGFFVKINTVVMRGVNDNEILDFVQFGQEKRIIVRFIELMPMVKSIGCYTDLYSPPYISCGEIKDRLKAIGKLRESEERTRFGSGPAKYYEIEGLPVVIGFINPISCKFCSDCNRLRLTSDGLLMPCLGSSSYFDLKRPLRERKIENVRGLIKEAVFLKPREHNLVSSSFTQCLMSQVGG